jgi:hypothetical protein
VVWLSDELTGRIAKARVDDFASCEAWRREAALRHYANSRFATTESELECRRPAEIMR